MNATILEMSDAFKVYTFVCEPDNEPIGHVHLLHGMSEHIGRYEQFARHLAGKGFLVTGHDHRGHGKTVDLNGLKGFADAENFSRVVQDVHEVIAYYRHRYPTTRFILFGHSMGSFVARRYVQLHGEEVDLAIFSGTGGNLAASLVAGQAVAYLSGKTTGVDQPDHFLNKLIFGGYNKSVHNPLTPFDWLSTDSEAVEAYYNDPNCGIVPTTQFFKDLFGLLAIIHSVDEINKIPKNLPILLVSGSEDPVGENGKGVWRVAKQYDKAAIKDVTVMLYEGKRHEMLHEKNKQQVYTFICDWIEKE